MKKKGERFYLGNVCFFLQEKTKLHTGQCESDLYSMDIGVLHSKIAACSPSYSSYSSCIVPRSMSAARLQ